MNVLQLAPTHAASLINAMKRVKNPRQMCAKVSCLVHSLTKQLKDIMNSNTYNPRGKNNMKILA